MKKVAFTLIEVLLAMTIFTSCIFIIANLQSRALNKVLRERDDIERTFLLKRGAYAGFITPPEDEKKIVNRLEYLEVTLTTQTVDIQSKSVLRDWKDSVKMLKTEAAWKKEGIYHEMTMMSIVFKPASKKQEKR
jgi:Tfp pilus assembly protein PilV